MREYLKLFLWAVKSALLDGKKMHYSYRASALSFYTITAIVPLFIVMASILSFFTIRFVRVIDLLYELFPQFPMGSQALLSLISEVLVGQRGWFGIISFLLAYIVASKLFTSLYRSLKIMFEATHYRLHYFMLYVIGIPLFILALFGLKLIAGILFMGISWLLDFPLFQLMLPSVFMQGLVSLNSHLMSWTFVGVIFLIYYALVPRAKKVLRHTVLISLVVGGLFVLLNEGFVLFLSLVTAVNPIYGAFGGVLGFLVWVYLSFVLLLLGARTLFYLEKQAEIETRPS